MDELLRRPLNLQTQNRSSSGSGLRQKLPNAEKPTELPSSRLALKAELRVVRTNRIYGILENFRVNIELSLRMQERFIETATFWTQMRQGSTSSRSPR